MDLQINCTQDGVKKYPLHKHNQYEIMLYLSGVGCLRTRKRSYPFSPGSIIIVPPGIEHGSMSENGFKNISIAGEFEQLLYLNHPVMLTDSGQKEGTQLATLIYHNRYGNKVYLLKLCEAYVHFLLQNLEFEDGIGLAVDKIKREIMLHFYDGNFRVSDLLHESGYAEDYIRAHFKRITSKTPNAFLTEIRIKHALFLMEVYVHTLSLQQIAERCGYTDYVYFSKKFKMIMGMSPRAYKNIILNINRT